METLVTGAAGFIGSQLILRLLEEGHTIVGIDNLNDYYDVQLKKDRLKQFADHPQFSFHKLDLADQGNINQLFANHKFELVVNLAAQAGVRYSIKNPHAYISSNLTGFCHILEGCRYYNVKHLVFASTSSVYGANTQQPFSEHVEAGHPLAMYAATKRANELMAHSYAHLYRLPCTGLRFFTVYGPWGRPDMALFKFTKSLLNDDGVIEIYNKGEMIRDFTFIDDIVEGINRVCQSPAKPDPNWDSNQPDPATSNAPFRIYNLGNNNPVRLMDFITALEKALGKTAKKKYLPIQPGDVPSTYADCSDLARDFNFKPNTSIEEGISKFVKWYLSYYQQKNGQ